MSRPATPFSARVDGDRFDAFYATATNMVTVWIPSLGSRSSAIDGEPVDAISNRLLQELVQEIRRPRYLAARWR